MYKWTGAYILRGLKPQQKKGFETSNSSANQNTFYIYWFLYQASKQHSKLNSHQ